MILFDQPVHNQVGLVVEITRKIIPGRFGNISVVEIPQKYQYW